MSDNSALYYGSIIDSVAEGVRLLSSFATVT